MNIFEHLDYRIILKMIIINRKKIDSSINNASIAKQIRVMPPYFSKVLNGYADLNHDQLYLASETLRLNSEEIDYMFLLLDFQRSALQERRIKILKKIKSIQANKLKTTSNIKHTNIETDQTKLYKYHLNPLNLIVHMALSIEKYQKNIELLSEHLKINITTIRTIVQDLEDEEIIKIIDGKYKSTIKDMHLPSDSPLCSPHQNLMRQLALGRFQRGQDDNDYTPSITYSGDTESQLEIRKEFIKFLKKADKIIDNAPAEKIFQMNFDLFSWT